MSDARDPETDQQLPTPNNSVAMQDLAIALIEARKELGLKKYGTLLQAFNGRSFLKDAIEETVDQLVYLLGMQTEAENTVRIKKEDWQIFCDQYQQAEEEPESRPIYPELPPIIEGIVMAEELPAPPTPEEFVNLFIGLPRPMQLEAAEILIQAKNRSSRAFVENWAPMTVVANAWYCNDEKCGAITTKATDPELSNPLHHFREVMVILPTKPVGG